LVTLLGADRRYKRRLPLPVASLNIFAPLI
jgi:hypothetical protein